MIFLDENVSVIGRSADFNALMKLSKERGYTYIQEHFAHDAGGMEVCYEAECAINQLERKMIAYELSAIREAEEEGTAPAGSGEESPGLWQKIKDGVIAFFDKIKEVILKIWNGIVGFIKHVIDFFTGKREAEFQKELADAKANATAEEKARILAALTRAECPDISKLTKNANACKKACDDLIANIEAQLSASGDAEGILKKVEKLQKEEDKLQDKVQETCDKLNDTEIGKTKVRSLEEIEAGVKTLNSFKGMFTDIEKKASSITKKTIDKANKGKASKEMKAVKANKKVVVSGLNGLKKVSSYLQKFFTTVSKAKAEYRKAVAAAKRAAKSNAKAVE